MCVCVCVCVCKEQEEKEEEEEKDEEEEEEEEEKSVNDNKTTSRQRWPFYAVQPCAQGISPILSAFTIRCSYLCGLFVDTHSDTRDKEHT